MTAYTGQAASLFGGTTLHSFAGLPLTASSASRYENLLTVIGNNEAKERWKSCRILVIDEVSMLSGQLLETVEYIARSLKNNNRPFGGIQVILRFSYRQPKIA